MTFTVPSVDDPADVVAPEVEQHQMLGALLRVGEELVAERACPPPASCRAAACRRSAGSSPRRRARAPGFPGSSRRSRIRRNRGSRGRATGSRGGARDRGRKPEAGKPPRSAATARPGRCRRRRCIPSRARTIARYSAGVVFETPRRSAAMSARLRRVLERPVELIDHIDQPVHRAVIGAARRKPRLGADRRHHR